MPPASTPRKNSARYVAARAIADAARSFPDIDAQLLSLDQMDPREARLALAIHRTVLQRWLTLEHLLNRYLRKPLRNMEPPLQGVLLSAAAQLLFMDRLPAHAVVDESVKLARAMVRAGAAGLVNAVLRRISELPDSAVRGKAWSPATDRLPLEDGYVPLRDGCLPQVGKWSDDAPAHQLHDFERHLAAATSHPVQLVRRWLKEHKASATIQLCTAGVRTPPLIVAVEERAAEERVDGEQETGDREQDAEQETGGGADQRSSRSLSVEQALEPREALFEPHAQPGFIIWHGSHSELIAFLRADVHRRVQDPTSAGVVAVAAGGRDLSPQLILDYCAGRGTKTRQLATMFPQAAIIATDTDDDRRAVLRDALKSAGHVRVVTVDEVATAIAQSAKPQAAFSGGVDLLLLDVPCTNSGVLARRPEARYRFNEASLKSLVRLQRNIVEKALPLLAPAGHLLYSTCSIDQAENQAQTQWIAQQFNCELLHESLTLPAGNGATYHDGGYVALLRRR